MSIILKAVAEYLQPHLPIVQYTDKLMEHRDGDYFSGRWVPDREVNHGPAVEVLYPDGYLMECVTFNVGAVIQHDVENGNVWVERNSTSGREHGHLYVDPADPDSFEKILEFLAVPEAMREEFLDEGTGSEVS